MEKQLEKQYLPLNIQLFGEELEEVAEETADDSDVNAGSDTEELEQTVEIEETVEEFELTDSSNDEIVEQPKVYTKEEHQAELNRVVDKIVARERQNAEKRYRPLVNTLKAGGFDSEDPNEIAISLQKNYEEQGIEVPKFYNSLSEREERALARADAEEVIELGEEMMRQRFTELYNKSNRTIREEEEMYLIGKENSTRIARKDLLEMGADPEKVFKDKNFLDFAKKVNAPVKEIYSMYKKLNGEVLTPPPSAGSVKSSNSEGQKYTQAKIDKMTPEQLAEVWDDPEFRKIAGL